MSSEPTRNPVPGGTNDPEYVWLEASCGHELRWPAGDVAPPDYECPEHGRVALWAQRNNPSPANLTPLARAAVARAGKEEA